MNFQKYLSDHGLEVSDHIFDRLQFLCKKFVQWNSKINLSAIRDEAGIWEKHICDSLLATKFFDFKGQKILDIGTGGGFPSLPLGIYCEGGSEVWALDSVGKKIKAVSSMAESLDIKNFQAVSGRFEDFGQDSKYREQFDIVVARAVAPWPILLEYALPFVKKGGKFIAYQGPSIMEELDDFENLEVRLGGEFKSILADKVGDSERIFVVVEKVKNTPKKYPRRNGEPRLKPLQ